MVDVGRVMELHNKGQRTDSYFDEQYGAAKSQKYKNFVNSVFGLISKKQGEANPIFSEENLRSGNGVYKTYRADRISQATKMTGDKYPFQYDFVVQNMMPNGLPTLDDQGRPVAQSRLPEQAGQVSEQTQEQPRESEPSLLPEPSKAIPESEGGNLPPATWSSLEKVGYDPSASEKTQITTTAATYEKIVNANAKEGMKAFSEKRTPNFQGK